MAEIKSIPSNIKSREVKSIDRSEPNTKKDQYDNMSSTLLNRQFAPLLFKNDLNNNSNGQINMANKSNQLLNLELSNINKFNQLTRADQYPRNVTKNNSNNDELSKYLQSTELQLSDKDKVIYDKFNLSNSSRKKNVDYSDYQGPPKKAAGQGFGIPDDYDKTYLGIDSRINNINNPRNIDYLDRGMIPPESFMINYSEVPYDKDSRIGAHTRTYKKMETKF